MVCRVSSEEQDAGISSAQMRVRRPLSLSTSSADGEKNSLPSQSHVAIHHMDAAEMNGRSRSQRGAAWRSHSNDSFASASDGAEEAHPSAPARRQQHSASGREDEECSSLPGQRRPKLPTLQQSFASGGRAVAEVKVDRPNFLPPQESSRRRPPDHAEPPCPAAPNDGPDEAEELLTWLTMASGSQPEHIARIVAWLLQLLKFDGIEELREEAVSTMKRLPDATLIRVFAEISSSQETQDLCMESHLKELAATAEGHLDRVEYQRVALCLAAFAATADTDAAEVLSNSAAPWALAAMRHSPEDAAVRFWSCALLQTIATHCRAWSVDMPQHEQAVELLLTVADQALRRPSWGPSSRMALEGTCRALAALWQSDTAYPDLNENALQIVSRMIDLPSAGVPWAHSALHFLERIAIGGGGRGCSPCFAEGCRRLSAVLNRSQDAVEVAAGIIALEGLVTSAFAEPPDSPGSMTDIEKEALGQALEVATGALKRFSENSRIQGAGATLLVLACESDFELAQAIDAMDLLTAMTSSGLLPFHVHARAIACLEREGD